MPRRDLSLAEQANVRAALRMLRVRLGGKNWISVERALPFAHSTLAEVMAERAEVSAALAFRVAKLLDVSLHHVLTGEALPPGTCRHCGRALDE
jgi:hypothetical protein